MNKSSWGGWFTVCNDWACSYEQAQLVHNVNMNGCVIREFLDCLPKEDQEPANYASIHVYVMEYLGLFI